ncbi:MAG: hypothetical protein LQ345_003006 [Seirophora villosa]|nr:MAG: hypothetical protein LQ345_003006 [Seirophora villosa]
MAEEIKQGCYNIARRPGRSFPVERHPYLYTTALVLAWTSWLCYFAIELFLASRITRKSIQGTKEVWTAIAAEFVLTFQELILALGLLLGLASLRRQPPRPSYELVGQYAPTIDVLITCCGEAIAVILDTVKAAVAQDYPPNCLRVLVLDDNQDDELRRCLIDLKPWLEERNLASVQYLSREVKKGSKSFFKAGNLNYGINACSEGKSPSEFFAGLDCDMIAEPDWLRKSVAHMLLSDGIGMVVSPQVN